MSKRLPTHKGQSISGGVSLSGGSVPEKGGLIQDQNGAGYLNGANGGLSMSNGYSRSRQTVLTSLTSGGAANITVAGNTDIQGALIATTDADGKDTGQLNMSTGTLSFSDLSNTTYSKNQSAGFSTGISLQSTNTTANKGSTDSGPASQSATNAPASQSDGLKADATYNSSTWQYTNASGYQKTKTLATIGQGVLAIGDTASSDDTTSLNRDVDSAQKDLFSVDRTQGDFDITVDHRLFTEEGRTQIEEDAKRTEITGGAIADVATKDSVGLLGDAADGVDSVLQNIGNKQDFFTATKEFVTGSGNQALVKTLNDPNATEEDRQAAIQGLSSSISNQFGLSPAKAKVAVLLAAKGAYSNGNIYVDPSVHLTLQDVVNTVGHETQHYLDDKQSTEPHNPQTYKDNREEYANVMGEATADYVGFNFENAGLGSFGGANNINSVTSSLAVRENTEAFLTQVQHDDVDFRLLTPEQVQRLHYLSGGNNTERFQQLYSAACADAKCSAGYAVGSDEYKYFKALEAYGQDNSEQLAELKDETFTVHDTQTQMYQNLNSREVPAFPDYSSLDKYHDTESRVAQESEQTRDSRMDELLGDSFWNPVLKSAMASVLVGGETVGLLYGANEGHVNGKVTFGSSVLDDVPLLEYRPGVRDPSLLPVVVENAGGGSFNALTSAVDAPIVGKLAESDAGADFPDVGAGTVLAPRFGSDIVTHQKLLDEYHSLDSEINIGYQGQTIPRDYGVPAYRTDTLGVVQEYDRYGNEIFYRGMRAGQVDPLIRGMGIQPTGETSIAPLWSYSQEFARGSGESLFRLILKPGTSDELFKIGGYNNKKTSEMFPELPHAAKGWSKKQAGIKFEGQDKFYVNDGKGIVNTQLGQGKALDIFNDNLLKIEPIDNK